MRCSRRQLLLGIIGSGVCWSGRSLAKGLFAVKGLESEQRRALAAAAERILPGAVEAGVPEYFDYWLGREPFSGYVKPLFKIAVIHLNRLAQKEHQKKFAALSAKQKDAILKRFEQGQVKVKRFDGRLFFEHLVRLTLEGYLGDPKYGGNKDKVGWKFIGHDHSCWWAPKQINSRRQSVRGLAY